MNEDKHVEYKSKLTEDLEREVIAFLNSNEGGRIFIGVDKSGNYVGIKDPDQKQLLIKDRLKNNILPSCMGGYLMLYWKSMREKISLRLLWLALEKPYYVRKFGMSEKEAVIWVGSSSEPMPTIYYIYAVIILPTMLYRIYGITTVNWGPFKQKLFFSLIPFSPH